LSTFAFSRIYLQLHRFEQMLAPQNSRSHEEDALEPNADTESLLPRDTWLSASQDRSCNQRWWYSSMAAFAVGTALMLLLHSRGSPLQSGNINPHETLEYQAVVPAAPPAVGEVGPIWGCGLVGNIPGISPDGTTQPETQRLIDAMKVSSTFGKATFWNWNLAPQTTDKGTEHLSKDFIFMPEQWGAGAVKEEYVRQAGVANFKDSNGHVSPATMADIFMGMNEPDIRGSCMGNMFGKCSSPCDPASVAADQCPAAHLDITLPPASPNDKGQCNCWQYSHATGVGFWPLPGCAGEQPLPQLFQDPACVNTVMANWKITAQRAVAKGYKYLTTPLVAVDLDYARKFIEAACGCTGGQCTCMDASCGCPVYVGFHFYAYDCQPSKAGGYKALSKRIQAVADIMETYPFVKGAIINEVGMLNCEPTSKNPICIPNSGTYPANSVPDHSCPATPDLPDGLATFIDRLFDLVITSKTRSGKPVVKAFSWFNENMAGGTYNLELFNSDGTVNKVGESYMRNCQRWGTATAGAFASANPAFAATGGASYT